MTFPSPPKQTHERKQHIIVAHSAYDMKTKLDDAYLDDWQVQSVTADGKTGWLAVLYKSVKI